MGRFIILFQTNAHVLYIQWTRVQYVFNQNAQSTNIGMVMNAQLFLVLHLLISKIIGVSTKIATKKLYVRLGIFGMGIIVSFIQILALMEPIGMETLVFPLVFALELKNI